MNLPSELETTLAMVADAVGEASKPWWIIGSAAVALHGGSVGKIRDVDVMMEIADARRLLVRTGSPLAADSNHPQFRSEVFGVWRKPPLPVEVFAGFSIATPKGWRPVTLRTREPVVVGGHRLFVPTATELRDLLLTFGRPKDLDRARLLSKI